MNDLPTSPRIIRVNGSPVRADGLYVLYWMIAARRTRSNFALDRAIAWAQELRKPLVVFEPLRVDYPWASDRLHRFVIDGMADNAEAFRHSPITYFPYVEPERGAGKGLLDAFAASACVVVTDNFPCFFLPRMVGVVAGRLDVALETVDGNGMLPLTLADRAYTAASHFRRFMQRELPGQLKICPNEEPLSDLQLPRLPQLPVPMTTRWHPVGPRLLNRGAVLTSLPIDHDVPVAPMTGGSNAAQRQLDTFIATRLEHYSDRQNDPDANVTSRLSPYLHFGHISSHQVFNAVMRQQRWSPTLLRQARPTGARQGWWGVSPSAEAFLDQLVVWRELAYNTSARLQDRYHRYESLPEWAQHTLHAHHNDARAHVYTPAQFETAATHDQLWNAIQRQLRQEGWFHNYMRMLWGKKILEYSKTPQQALGIMTAIMNRWSLDGRNPNAYAGYFWTLGRYDRPWPERPIYGKVRSMSSERTRQKVDVEEYLRTYGES